MNLLPRAEILCPLSVLERVRIIEVFLRGNVREFCRYRGNCPHWRGVHIERFECVIWLFHYGPEPSIN